MKRRDRMQINLWRAIKPRMGLQLLMVAILPGVIGHLGGEVQGAPADNNCITQTTAQINQVRYLGKNSNGDDNIAVEWQVFSISECVPFGSGLFIPDRVNIPLFGFEIRVKIKRRFGNEDSGFVFKREILPSGPKTTFVAIPRGALETDPVSYTATLKTTAGAVQTFNRVITGLGVPSLTGATQSTNQHSSVPNIAASCFPSLSVSAINFLPGSGGTPDNVAITWSSGIVTAMCNEQPRFKVKVIVKRPAGNLDTVETVFAPNSNSAQLQLPGAASGATNFNVTITALAGDVIEKTSTQSGNF